MFEEETHFANLSKGQERQTDISYFVLDVIPFPNTAKICNKVNFMNKGERILVVSKALTASRVISPLFSFPPKLTRARVCFEIELGTLWYKT